MPNFNSIVSYTGDGATTRWNFSFQGGYISPEHVFVAINGAEPAPAVLDGSNTVLLDPAVADGDLITILRRTPMTGPLVDWMDGADVSESNLDVMSRQSVFVAAETSDRAEQVVLRSLSLPLGETTETLPAKSDRAGTLLGFDNDGAPTAVTTTDLGIDQAVTNAALAYKSETDRARENHTGQQPISSVTALGTALVASVPTRPAYLEQRIAAQFGRGMLASEVPFLVTDQLITNAPLQAGATEIAVTDISKFVSGSTIALDYADGTIGFHSVIQKGSVLVIAPALEKDVAVGAGVERFWFDPAHPGKRAMRGFAQRIANGTEYDLAMPFGQTIVSTDKPAEHLRAIGSSDIAPIDRSRVGHDGTTGTAARFASPVAYVSNVADGEGVTTGLYKVTKPGRYLGLVRGYFRAKTVSYAIRAKDHLGRVLATYTVPVGSRECFRTFTFPFATRSSEAVEIEVVATGGATRSANEYFAIGKVMAFEAPATNGPVIGIRDSNVVVIGDSWVAGAAPAVPEREGLAHHLALALPDANVINKGIGGNLLIDVLDRWDTDVTPYKPAYVVVCTGTNDAYRPYSTVFDPNARGALLDTYRKLVERCSREGIRLILFGPPSLAEVDTPSAPSLAPWELDDRSYAYSVDLESDFVPATAPEVEVEEPEPETPTYPLEINTLIKAVVPANDILIRRNVTRRTTIPADFAGSFATVGLTPSANWVGSVRKNAGEVGTVTVDTAGTTSFSTSGVPIVLLPGERLELIAPASSDPAFTNAAFTFAMTQE